MATPHKRPRTEVLQKEIVAFVKERPGLHTRRGILRNLERWNLSMSSYYYSVFKMLEDTRLVEYKRTTDGLLKVFPGPNAKHFVGDAAANGGG